MSAGYNYNLNNEGYQLSEQMQRNTKNVHNNNQGHGNLYLILRLLIYGP